MATVATPIAGSSKPHPPITILKRNRADVPLSQTKFLKKTAKGKVLSCMSHAARCNRLLTEVLRERYVRDDVPCGYAACHLCSNFPGYKAILPKTGYSNHAKFTGKQGHFLVIDTNIVLHQVSLCKPTVLDLY
jgi:exosome complex exonuclease DIS3/RRP44